MTLNDFIDKISDESLRLLLKEIAKEFPIIEYALKQIASETLKNGGED